MYIFLNTGKQCDGRSQCPEGEDEIGCDELIKLNPCGWKELVLCPSNKKCVRSLKICNGIYDCEDFSDEMVCTCETVRGMMTCPGAATCGRECIPHTWVCDGHSDCPGALDETNCSSSSKHCLIHFRTKCTNYI